MSCCEKENGESVLGGIALGADIQGCEVLDKWVRSGVCWEVRSCIVHFLEGITAEIIQCRASLPGSVFHFVWYIRRWRLCPECVCSRRKEKELANMQDAVRGPKFGDSTR